MENYTTLDVQFYYPTLICVPFIYCVTSLFQDISKVFVLLFDALRMSKYFILMCFSDTFCAAKGDAVSSTVLCNIPL